MTEKLYCDCQEIGVPKIQFIEEQEALWIKFGGKMSETIHTYPDGAIFARDEERVDLPEHEKYIEENPLIKILIAPIGGAKLTHEQVEEMFRYANYFLQNLRAKPNNNYSRGRCCYGGIPMLKC